MRLIKENIAKIAGIIRCVRNDTFSVNLYAKLVERKLESHPPIAIPSPAFFPAFDIVEMSAQIAKLMTVYTETVAQ